MTLTKFTTAIIFTLFLSTSSWAASATMHVKGMVCAFCAQGIKKQFSKEAAVEKIIVDLDHMLVTAEFKKGADIPDEKLRTLISKAGFSVEKIERRK
jgi:copper chaperone CopZ